MPLRILAFCDIHGKESGLEYIQRKCQEVSPGVAVIAGDIVCEAPVTHARSTLDAIRAPVFLVPGNMDPPNALEQAIAGSVNCHDLSGVRKTMSDIGFVGIGAGRSGFSSPISDLARIMRPGDVLVSHFPPHGFNDRAYNGEHIGSKGLLGSSDELRPRLVISGHVHECPGVMRSGGTVFVNPGPAFQQRCAVIDIGHGDDIEARIVTG